MARKKIKRIGILTGGGDCPGLNAVIRGVTKPALDNGLEVFGILDGFEGLVEGKVQQLFNKDVSGILSLGGTILGSSNKGDPFHWPEEVNGNIMRTKKAYFQIFIAEFICDYCFTTSSNEKIINCFRMGPI